MPEPTDDELVRWLRAESRTTMYYSREAKFNEIPTREELTARVLSALIKYDGENAYSMVDHIVDAVLERFTKESSDV